MWSEPPINKLPWQIFVSTLKTSVPISQSDLPEGRAAVWEQKNVTERLFSPWH